ncbi:hypothetical protein ACQ4LE_004680 [Meloidogyne hapla]|uniref:MYND-type domain-containing protein n=1 Tax=Meloidogyne hapla TaxID=6305 RepID=A0A1I8BIX9_MELHA
MSKRNTENHGEPVNLDSFLEFVSLEMSIYSKRLATFKGSWAYNNDENAQCSSERMARAGFYCSELKPNADCARCYVCQHELLWDAQDDPWDEHRNHRPDCELVKIGKQDESEFTCREQLRILSFIYSCRQNVIVDDSIEDLRALMDKLMADVDKVMRTNGV